MNAIVLPRMFIPVMCRDISRLDGVRNYYTQTIRELMKHIRLPINAGCAMLNGRAWMLVCMLGLLSHAMSNDLLAQTPSVFFSESFDSVTPPALPPGWGDGDDAWATSSSVASSGSGANNLTISGGQVAGVQTPMINLSGMTSGTIEFLARRTSTYPQSNLVVLASIDGGATFSTTLLDQGEALPATDGSYGTVSMAVPAGLLGQSQVVLLFSALGGNTAGSNIRIDDVTLAGEGDTTVGNSVVGFMAETSILEDASGVVDVPVLLDFTNTESLQALQLTLRWDDDALNLANVVAGSAISDAATWQLSFNELASEARIVLVSNGTIALPESRYEPLFTLQFGLGTTTSSPEVVVTLENVVGALAVPTGDDAALVPGTATHTITLATGDAVFSPDATNLDAGTPLIDTVTEAVLTVTNTGTADLVISEVLSSNDLFVVDPLTATVNAGTSQQFRISFAPTFAVFGQQAAAFTFFHNAAGGSDIISIAGTGRGGRGDASQDGRVDVQDLVFGIDYVVQADTPDALQLTSMDLFPVGAADGALDVRDLTVLVQAILAGAWPDDVPLPASAPMNTLENITTIASSTDVQVQPVIDGDQGMLVLRTEVPLRAVQLTLSTDASMQEVLQQAAAAQDEQTGFSTQLMYNPWDGTLRVLAVRMDGASVEPGNYTLLDMPQYIEDMVFDLEGVAIGVDRQRLSVAMAGATETGSESPEEVSRLQLGVPYPNPFIRSINRTMHASLALAADQPVRVEIFDVLGRQVARLGDPVGESGHQVVSWDGSDQEGKWVAPGLYLIRATQGHQRLTRTVIVH